MPQKIPEDFYIFCTPKDDPDSNSHIKIIDPDSPFAGTIFVVNYIKLRRKFFGIFGPYVMKFDYRVVEPPLDESVQPKGKEFKNLIGDIIVDIWDKHYA